MANRKVKAELEIEGKDSTSPAFRSVATRMGQIERQMSRFNRTAADFDRKMTSISRQSSGMQRAAEGVSKAGLLLRNGIAGYGAYEIARATVGTVKDFAALERQMTRIGNTAGVSKQETDDALQSMQQQAQKLALPLEDAISALEVMTSAGMEFKEAMSFLPSVLAATQATGAASSEMANTTFQAANALKITAGEMQRTFDMINEAGKAGSFEAKDMATYLPKLANGFAAVGYKGTEAISQLSAYMQTLRAHTADSSTAANQMENILAKMYSQETANKFKDFGVNLEAEMKKRIAAGQKPLEAFVELSRKTLNGDLTKLSRLFGDMQVQQGMMSLITDAETFRRVIGIINDSRVDGSVQRDNQRILGETQAKIDRLSGAMGRLKKNYGEAIADVSMPFIDNEVKASDRAAAVQRGMEKRGYNWFRRQLGTVNKDEGDQLAYEGGYRDDAFLAEYWARRYGAGKGDPRRPKASTGRHNTPVTLPEFPGGGRNYTNKTLPASAAPVPGTRPALDPKTHSGSDLQRQYLQYGQGRAAASAISSEVANMDVFRGVREKIEQSSADINQAAQSLSTNGQEAGAAIKGAGDSLVSGLLGAVRELNTVASKFQNIKITATTVGAQGGRGLVNADTGRTFPPEISKPTGGGGW